MARKVIILAGAPESNSLDWASPDLLSSLSGPIAHFAGLAPLPPSTSGPAPTPAPDPSLRHAVWRSIPLERKRMPTGFSQQHDFALVDRFPTCNNFFTPAGASSFQTSFQSTSTTASSRGPAEVTGGGGGDDVLSQFYEYSLAAHDDITSSQLGVSSDATESQEDTTSVNNSTASFRSGASSTAASVREPLTHHGGQHLSDLEDIPSAGYLDSISPQTVTANLIVGIISIASPRSVKTRWGSSRSLVEVLVGDETRSGFAVTFWLPSDAIEQSVLAGLRTQDIVLMQNVALHVFRKKVYGSSLRKNLTKVHLLYRTKLDDEDLGGYYSSADLASASRRGRKIHPQLQKTRVVRDWVLRFVGQGNYPSKKRKLGTRTWDMPPPHDTQ